MPNKNYLKGNNMSSIYMGFNPSANQAAREMQANNSSLNKALTSLTTGNRINTAGDDAAGYTIGKNMEVKITGMKRAVRNANDAISAFQVLGGSLKGLTDRVARLQELATQANSSFNGAGDIANIQKEVSSLIAGIDSDAKQANFNGVNLMEKEREFSVQVGDSASDQIKLNVESMTVKSLGMDKIDFSVFSSETRYLQKAPATGVTVAKGTDTTVTAIVAGDIKLGTTAVDITDFNASDNLTIAADDDFTAISTASMANGAKGMFALVDQHGNAVADKIAIQNDTKDKYAILNLVTSMDAAGKASVAVSLNGTDALDQNDFNALYTLSTPISATTGIDSVVKPKVQESAAARVIDDTNITIAPGTTSVPTALGTASGKITELKQVLDNSGAVEEGKFLLSVTTQSSGDVELFEVKINKIEVMNGSKRKMTLDVVGPHTEVMKEYDATTVSKDTLLGKLKEAYDKINEVSSTVGATITGLNNTIESLSTNISNTADAHARIIKADIIETYSEASSRKVQQQAIAQAMQMANSLTEIALQAMR